MKELDNIMNSIDFRLKVKDVRVGELLRALELCYIVKEAIEDELDIRGYTEEIK